MIRYETMTTARTSTTKTFWEAPSMRMTTSCRGTKQDPMSQRGDLDALATATEAETIAMACLATANRTLRDFSPEATSGTTVTWLLLSATGAAGSAKETAGTKVSHLQWSALGATESREAREARREERRSDCTHTQRTASVQRICSDRLHTETSMFAREALERH